MNAANQKRIRESRGGAYEKRGAFFMRITIGPQKRRAEHLPWCTCLADAQARAELVQGWVNRLRASGHADFVEQFVERGATGDLEKLAAYEQSVGELARDEAEKIPEAEPRKGGTTFEDFVMQWVKGELAVLYPDHVERKRAGHARLRPRRTLFREQSLANANSALVHDPQAVLQRFLGE